VTIRPRPPLEVSPGGAIGAISPGLPLLVKSWLPRSASVTLGVTGALGDEDFTLPPQPVSLEPGQSARLSLPLPGAALARVDALAAAMKHARLRWQATPTTGPPMEGDLEVPLRRGFRGPKLGVAPTVDGQFSPAEWVGAAKLSGFVKHDDARPAGRQTDVYVGHDGGKLYVAYVCHGQPQPRAVPRAHDGAVWEDDCVETFLQPPGGETYYHLAVNAAGARFEARCPGSDASWNPEWEAQAGRLADGWVVEIAVPWKALQGPPEGLWRVNFGREEQDTKQATCWSPTGGGFHIPARFGDMAL